MPALEVNPVPAPHLAARLATFVCDAFRYAASTSEDDVRRLIASPYSRLSRADARAAIVTAGPRTSVTGVPAARDFAQALRTIVAVYRAQGATARELLRATRLGFALDDGADASETATLNGLERIAVAFDGGHPVEWDAADAADAFERIADELAASELGAPAGEPLGPHSAEAPAPVEKPRSHYSASSLGAYAECERKWYYRYVCAAVEDKGSSASFYGSAFHWALEQFHREFPRGDSAPREVLQNKLDGWIQTAFERFRGRFETAVEYELQTRRARRTGRRYLGWFLERARAHPFSVIENEAKVELEMGGQMFKGYIDRLDRDDATGAVTVVDYKTGSIAESAAEYRERVAEFSDFQLPFYYWARTAAGDRVTRLALVPLKDALREVDPVELEVVPVAAPAARWKDGTTGTIGIDELERAKAKMIELARRLSNDPLDRFPVTDDPEACTFCAYKSACRNRPMRREERFSA
jgi:hypothetical protein